MLHLSYWALTRNLALQWKSHVPKLRPSQNQVVCVFFFFFKETGVDSPSLSARGSRPSGRTSGWGRSHEEVRDVASWVVPHVERPQFHGPLLKRTRCQHTSLKENLWMKAQHEGALTPACIVQKNQAVSSSLSVSCETNHLPDCLKISEVSHFFFHSLLSNCLNLTGKSTVWFSVSEKSSK